MPNNWYHKHNKVINAATKFGGKPGWRFHQNLPNLKQIVGSGVCWAISMEYLRLIRKGLHPQTYYGVYRSEKNGKITMHGANIDAVLSLARENRELNAGPNYFDMKLQNEPDFIVLSRSEVHDLNPVEIMSHAPSMANRDIDGNVLVFIYGKRGGHAMTYRRILGKVHFFDPNYGEYIFRTTKDFMNFFSYFLPIIYGDEYRTFEYRQLSA